MFLIKKKAKKSIKVGPNSKDSSTKKSASPGPNSKGGVRNVQKIKCTKIAKLVCYFRWRTGWVTRFGESQLS